MQHIWSTLYLYLFVKNHVIFYHHLEFICTVVTGVVKRKYGGWLKYCKIDGNIARAGTLVSIIRF